MTQQEDILQQKNFIHQFLWNAYSNMEMEDEVHEPFDVEKLYQRYKVLLDELIAEGIYKDINLSHVR
jgi:hypothetical protein